MNAHYLFINEYHWRRATIYYHFPHSCNFSVAGNTIGHLSYDSQSFQLCESVTNRKPEASKPFVISSSLLTVKRDGRNWVLCCKSKMAACLEEQQESTDEERLQNMLLRIATSNVIVKTQQKNEPDFTVEQKLDILKDILDKNPATFLMRFGKCISPEHLVYFENVDKEKSNFELTFRIKELNNFFDEKKNHVHVQNRRYKALQRLMTNSNYFDENEMRRRNPLLYEQYVGQYMTEDEKLARDRAEQCSMPTLSGVLLQTFDSRETEWIFQCQKEKEEEQLCEEDSDSDSETDNDCVTSPIKGIPSEAERKLLKEEFLSEMQAKFLAGQDEEFDYSEVDMNDDYDDLKLRERDEEEAYFDDDDDDDDEVENESEMKET